MEKVLINTLIFFLFASQVLHIYGKMTVLRGSPSHPYSSRCVRKLICLSEDDGGALIWNDNLIWKNNIPDRPRDTQFHSLNKFSNKELDCELNSDNSCLGLWNRQNWSLTNSLKTPMGPVFDQRWEGFKEYENLEDSYDRVDVTAAKATLSFSIRALRDAYILLCNSEYFNRDLCYWIIIGGWSNTLSAIRKCPTGLPLPGKFPEAGSKCMKNLVSFRHSPLSKTEWRSFVITWNSAIRKISVYNTNRIIMTYIDEEIPRRSSGDYRVFVRSSAEMLVRFHIYNFLHTTLENAILTSPIFQPINGTICIQLLVGLCAKCDAHIVLRDVTNSKELQTVIVNSSSKAIINGLPMWQSVKIERSFSTNDNNNNNNLTIQLIPKLSTSISNPLWAIANVRQCPPNGSLRKGVIYAEEYHDHVIGSFNPTISCQKLFYDKDTIVNPTTSASEYVDLDDANCPEGKIGPQCLFSCKYDLESNDDCRKIAICYKNGCTCPPGFWGSGCFNSCGSNTYGRRCKKTCGSCLSEVSHSPCNKVTGACYKGCDNTKKVYIPPLCEISIDKLNAPVITSTSKTTIHAVLPMIWKNQYNEEIISYSFVIKGQMDYHVEHPWSRIFQNTTQLIGYFENLKPGTTYQISCSLSIGKIKIQGDWQSVDTDCDPVKNFSVMSEETSMMINWQSNANQLYLCPANWYHLVVRNIDADIQVVNGSVTDFPYKLSHLTSYTTFYVTIFHRNQKLFSQEIRTHEGVPSKVLGLQKMLSSDTQLTLIWRPPDKPNGEIIRYEVILKVKKYHGCEDLKLPTPDNHIITKSTTDTTITVLDLHPYTSYSAYIIAHNSRHGGTRAEITFDTDRSEIPAEVFGYLTVQDWKLSWSPPEDCTTISGPIKARIKILGISDAVKDFNVTKETSYNFFNLNEMKSRLNGVERYIARVYVIRDYSSSENPFAYQECEFKTPPTAPPKVSNLEVVEIDTRQTPATIHLRWQSPFPPVNGKLRNYAIQSCNKRDEYCTTIEVQLNDFCDLWDNYICGIIQKPLESSQEIQVVAYNVNVTEASPPTLLTKEMLDNTTPDVPGDYTFIINNNSVVDLKWCHPWKTGDHLQSFHIRIVEISSNLRKHVSQSSKIYEYPVIKYMRNYSERLYLFPSTQYYIYIQAMTIANKSSSTKYVEVRTPATIAFDGDVQITVHESNSTILLNIPPVLNDTHDSIMHIIVKGSHPCEQYSEVPENIRARIDIEANEIAWQAAKVSTSELVGKQFTVGDNETYGSAINCPLKFEQLTLYEITIIVTGSSFLTGLIMFATSIRIGDEPSKHHEVWIIPVTLFFVVAVAVFYFYRRKKRKLHEQAAKDETDLSWSSENCLSYIPTKNEDFVKMKADDVLLKDFYQN